MAFHARNRRVPSRSRDGGTESVLGLAGWLFADLLLALSVVFLVAQDRPGGDSLEALRKALTTANEKISQLEDENDSLKNQVEELQRLCDLSKKVCGGNSGLISTEQLIISPVKNGAAQLSLAQMKRAITNADLKIEETRTLVRTETTWESLRKKDRRIGLVIFYTRDNEALQRQARNNLRLVIQAFVEKKIVDVEQLEKSSDGNLQYGNFPILKVYNDKNLDKSDLEIRALMFTKIVSVSSTSP